MSGTCSHRADSSKRCTSTTLVTTQMLTQMLLATVSLCVLCETAVRSRPCAQLQPQRHEHVLLDGVGGCFRGLAFFRLQRCLVWLLLPQLGEQRLGPSSG